MVPSPNLPKPQHLSTGDTQGTHKHVRGGHTKTNCGKLREIVDHNPPAPPLHPGSRLGGCAPLQPGGATLCRARPRYPTFVFLSLPQPLMIICTCWCPTR